MRIPRLVVLLLSISLAATPKIVVAQSIDQLLQQVNTAQAAEDYANAEAIWRTIIDRDPKYAIAYNGLANILYKQGKLTDAAVAYKQAIQLDPKFVIAYNGLGNVLNKQGQLEAAAVAYRQAIQLDPKFMIAYYNLGIILSSQQKLDEAVKTYRQAIQLEPKFANTYNNLGVVLYDQKKLEEAVIAYHKAIELDPKLAIAYNNLGVVIYDQKNIEEALASYRQAIQLDPTLAIAYNNLGIIFSNQKKLEEALVAYQQAIQLNPQLTIAYYNSGVTLSDQGKLPEAINAYRKVLTLPDDITRSGKIHALAHNAIGIIFRQQDKLEAAIAAFEQASTIDPEFVYARTNLEAARRTLQIAQQGEISDDRPWLPKDDFLNVLRPVVLVVADFSSRQRQGSERGTGIVIKREGKRTLIITNRHVIYDQQSNQMGKDIRVEFFSNPPEGKSRMGRKVKLLAMTNPEDEIDLAVLEVIGDLPDDIQPLPIGDTPISRGMPIRAIGNPLRGLPWLMVDGKIASYNHQQIQIYGSAISPGTSGGAIINSENKLLGIIVEAEANGEIGFAYTTNTIMEKMRAWGIP